MCFSSNKLDRNPKRNYGYKCVQVVGENCVSRLYHHLWTKGLNKSSRTSVDYDADPIFPHSVTIYKGFHLFTTRDGARSWTFRPLGKSRVIKVYFNKKDVVACDEDQIVITQGRTDLKPH